VEQLRTKEEQLRTKEELLRKQLLLKEEQLRDDKKQLRQKEEELLKGLAALAKKINAPSTFGLILNWPQVEGLLHHRPPGPGDGALHVNLFSKAMAQFQYELMQQPKWDNETSTFVELLCCEMCKVFGSEKERQECFLNIFNQYFKGFPCRPLSGIIESEGSILQRTDLGVDALLLNLEVKNEKGLTSTDCSMQNLGYFVQYWASISNEALKKRARSFLVSLEGCTLSVYGALVVNNNIVHMDPLSSSLALLPLRDDPRHMDHLGSFALALRNCLPQLLSELNDKHEPACEFPYLVEWPALNLAWKYELELKRRVFIAKLEPSKERVVVKFSTDKPAFELQRLLASHDYAPSLLAHFEIQPYWHVTISDYSEPLDTFASLSDAQKRRLGEAVQLMHQHGWVHGDLRLPNILRLQQDRIHIIDFDFSGRENVAVYPPFLNMDDIRWPQGVAAGAPLLRNHDVEMLAQIIGDK
jgi:hypothetical protein